LFPFVKQSAIKSAARATSDSSFFNDCSVSIEPLMALSRIEEESGMEMTVEAKNGARYRVRTCDPYRVKVVLYH
jgi:hypothetical protein